MSVSNLNVNLSGTCSNLEDYMLNCSNNSQVHNSIGHVNTVGVFIPALSVITASAPANPIKLVFDPIQLTHYLDYNKSSAGTISFNPKDDQVTSAHETSLEDDLIGTRDALMTISKSGKEVLDWKLIQSIVDNTCAPEYECYLPIAEMLMAAKKQGFNEGNLR